MRFPCTTSWNRWFWDCCGKKETSKFDQKSSFSRVQKSIKNRSKTCFLFYTPAQSFCHFSESNWPPRKTTISPIFGPSIFDQILSLPHNYSQTTSDHQCCKIVKIDPKVHFGHFDDFDHFGQKSIWQPRNHLDPPREHRWYLGNWPPPRTCFCQFSRFHQLSGQKGGLNLVPHLFIARWSGVRTLLHRATARSDLATHISILNFDVLYFSQIDFATWFDDDDSDEHLF